MKAEEFRIGNLLQDQKGNLLRVNELSEDGSTALYVIDTSKFQLPNGWKSEYIPLTEEILLKCGFEYELGYGYRNKSITGLMLKSIGTSDYNAFTYCGITIEIPSLHQLQNLIFALTGEELEINL